MSARILRPSWMALLALAASAAVAGAQSLGELAAKEQQRREKERQKRGGSSKVITESDLGGAGRGTFSNAGASSGLPSPESSASPSPAAGTAASASAEKKEKTPDEIRAEEISAWRQRLAAARKEVTDLTERLNRLQQSLNDLTGPIYGASRTTVLNQFETTKSELAAANQKVADLEEEGRRKSYQ